jgi:hypothetical protein
MVGIFTGMNAYGVALGQVWAFAKDVQLATPWHIDVRKYFSDNTSAKEVTESFKKQRTTTYGNNFVVADAGGHENSDETGFSIEMSAKYFASFGPNDQRELAALHNGVPYAYPITNGVYRGDVSFDLDIRARQLSANGPDGDPRDANSYIQRYKGQYDRIVAYEEKGVLIGHAEAQAISSETAMRGSSLQIATYANSDRDMWVSYSKINDDGSVTQAYDRAWVNIPFKNYLVDLKLVNGVVTIKNWFKERTNLILRHIGPNKISENLLDLNHQEVLTTGINLARGEVLELYEGNTLIDRLVRK